MDSPPPPIEPTGVFEGLRPGAIVLGALVDHVATFVTSATLVAWLGVRASQAGEEVSEEALEALAASPEFLALSLVVGALCTLLGGFVGARRAGCHFARHGAFVALASLLLGLLLYLPEARGEPVTPLWYDLLGAGMMLPAGAAGGWLAGRSADG